MLRSALIILTGKIFCCITIYALFRMTCGVVSPVTIGSLWRSVIGHPNTDLV